jgi:electron transfer flavoprotein beta subunit
MKILVTVKRVIDPYVRIRVNADQSGVETRNVKMAMNPFDEIALEAAIRFREKQIAQEIVIVTIGPEVCQETLRHGLALGADRAILIQSDKQYCSLNRAKILQKIIQQEQPNLVLMGKQAIDDDNNQTPQMLAALLNWPQITFASQLDIAEDELQGTREIDQGLETLQTKLPAIASVDLRLNEPRYASLPNIMKAKQKPLQIIELESFGLQLTDRLKTLQIKNPAPRAGGVLVDSVAALLDKLQHEAKVLP